VAQRTAELGRAADAGWAATGARRLEPPRREVDDLESKVKELKEAGLSFRNEIVTGPGGKQIVLEDEDGNPIELFEARP
jgi:hypothetical protein